MIDDDNAILFVHRLLITEVEEFNKGSFSVFCIIMYLEYDFID